MKVLIRFWFRRRFTKALDKADWRTATFYAHSEAGTEVARLRAMMTTIDPQYTSPKTVAQLGGQS